MMGNRRLVTYDPDTGEVMEGSLVYFGKRTPHPYGANMMQVNQDWLAEFAARKDVSGRTLRVFLLLASKCDFENWLHVSQMEIGAELGLDKSDITRAIKQLVDLGVIIRGPKAGRANSFKFNPHAGWKGKVVKLKPAIDSHLKSVTGGRRDELTAAELEAMGQTRFPTL